MTQGPLLQHRRGGALPGGLPGAGLLLRLGNFLPAGEDVLQALDRLQGRVTHVHLKDRAFAPTFAQNGAAAQDGRLLYPAPVGRGTCPWGTW